MSIIGNARPEPRQLDYVLDVLEPLKGLSAVDYRAAAAMYGERKQQVRDDGGTGSWVFSIGKSAPRRPRTVSAGGLTYISASQPGGNGPAPKLCIV